MLFRPTAIIRTCFLVGTCALLCAGSSAFAQEDLRRLDKNGDGKLDIKFEVPEQARAAIARAAEKAGLSLTQPLPIDKLTEALRASREGNSQGDRPSEGRSDEGRREEERSRDDRSREEERSRDERPRDDRSRDERYGRDRGREEERSRGNESSSRDSRSGSSTPANTGKTNAATSASIKAIDGIPGFGVATNGAPLVPGFDVPLHTSTGSQKPVEQLYDPRAVERAKRTLSENDRNKNGVLDPEELEASRWTNPPIEESDTNKDGKMNLHELSARYAKRYGWNDPPGTVKAGSSGSDNRGGGDKNDDGDKTKKYAESLLKQYDENKDGLLQKDEWMKMRSDYHSADQNGDHVLTQEEIYVKLVALSGPSTGGSSSSSGGSTSSGGSGSRDGRDGKPGGYGNRPGGSGSSSKPGKPGEAKIQRVLTPTERLPKGLPDWFLRNDSDGDGQILMAEYAPAWTDATAAEFMKYDLNGDGYITPKECLTALEAMKKK